MEDTKLPIGKVLLEGYRCRCGHEWLPRDRSREPRVCPKCKSPNWDRLKQTIGVGGNLAK